MKLYLSSYRLGNYSAELVKMVGENKKVAIIMNARDDRDISDRGEKLAEEIVDLESLGFEPEELDLRKYFGKTDELSRDLEKFSMVWVRGGNTFILKRAFEQSGFDFRVTDLVHKNKIVYAGYSAGVCICAPTLKGTELVDDSEFVPEGYKADFSWDGLHFLDYSVAVHYKSDHYESALVDKEVEYLEKNKMPYKTLRDGEVIIVDEVLDLEK